MRFNLTPSITISTQEELEDALESLTASGVDSDWVDHLRSRAEPFTTKRTVGAFVSGVLGRGLTTDEQTE